MKQGHVLHLLNGELAKRARGLLAAGALMPADLLLVDAVAGRFGETRVDVLLGLAFAVRAPRAGHVGVHLPTISSQVDDERVGREALPGADEVDDVEAEVLLMWPEDVLAWERAVKASPMVGPPERAGCPFVTQELRDGRLLVMTRRMWREQERLALAARGLASGTPSLVLEESALQAGVLRMFGGPDSQGARAVVAAASRQLTVITGGPGTGKTYSIKRLLALLMEASLNAEGQPGQATPLRIELAAPTGKAAVRMAQAIAEDLDGLDVSDAVREGLASLRPQTLHKLLGLRPDGSSRHGTDRPLLADLVVVDEASMVDLTLMRRLFEAIPPGARLVLLGDRDQLASVEAGTVLADFVSPVLDGSAVPSQVLHGAVVPFDTNHRFKEAPTVAAIASALKGVGNDGAEQVVDWMTNKAVAEGETEPHRITHLGASSSEGRPDALQLDALAAPYIAGDGFVGVLGAAIRAHGQTSTALRDPAFHGELLRALEGYRVLAVHRRGPLGVSGLERELVRRCKAALEQAIRDRKGLAPGAPVNLRAKGEHWLGRPVLVTRNSYEVGLMNGDIGLVLPTSKGLAVVFEVKGDGPDAGAGTRVIALARLPEHMGAFAMTVHKSQGSQFRRVAMVLAGRDSAIQTRELVYTGITRTSARLDWLGDPDELRRAVARRVGRASGLGDLLWRP